MKKWQFLAVMVMAAIFIASCATSVAKKEKVPRPIAKAPAEPIIAAPIPATGEYTVEETTVKGVFEVVEVQRDKVTIKVPMPDSATVNLADIAVFASVGWTDGQSWKIVSSDDYSRFVSKMEMTGEGSEKVSVELPNKGNGWFWLRIWGQNKADKNWLWIKQGPYVRLDTAGNPGYEAIVNNRTGESRPVPKEYNNRQ